MSNSEARNDDELKEKEEASEEVRQKALIGVVADLVMVSTTAQQAMANSEGAQAFAVMQQLAGQLIDLALGPEWAKENDAAVKEALQARVDVIRQGVEQQINGAQMGHA